MAVGRGGGTNRDRGGRQQPPALSLAAAQTGGREATRLTPPSRSATLPTRTPTMESATSSQPPRGTSSSRSSWDAMQRLPTTYRAHLQHDPRSITTQESNLAPQNPRIASKNSQLPLATSHPQPRSLICVRRRSDRCADFRRHSRMLRLPAECPSLVHLSRPACIPCHLLASVVVRHPRHQ